MIRFFGVVDWFAGHSSCLTSFLLFPPLPKVVHVEQECFSCRVFADRRSQFYGVGEGGSWVSPRQCVTRGVSVLLHVNIFFPLFGVAQTPVSLVYRNPPVFVRLGRASAAGTFLSGPGRKREVSPRRLVRLYLLGV